VITPPFQHTDAIIFDLGNVVINLDIPRTEQYLKELMGSAHHKVMEQLEKEGIFNRYEKGEISTEYFVDSILALAPNASNREQVITAWNAMLQDIPDSRFEILQQAKQHYRTFCLSNTNELHINFIHEMLQENRKLKNLNPYFERVYLSHEMGMRKPDREIFEKVLEDNQLKAERTVFIDDTKGHLLGAEKTGLRTFHMSPDTSLETLFQFS
jgi:putative hydrolase of the HAD superfamily